MPGLALQGIKVLDLSRVLAGPYCTLVLADLGAEVIKVEVPGVGDDARSFGPFLQGESAYFMSLNRNKKSIILNLKDEAGRGIFRRLVTQFDVLVENFRPGTMAKLGLGYEELARVNPGLIYTAISGFGQTGPYRDRPAYDIVVQGMGGIMSITGEPGGIPTRVGASLGDITAALFAVTGILAALHQRGLTGEGQLVDVAMLDGQVAILENAIARYEVMGQVPGPLGNRHPSITPFTSVRAADGWLIIAIGNDSLWKRFCRLIERPELADDPRFATNPARTDNWPELERILAGIFGARPVAQWLPVLEEAGIPCGPINDIARVVADPQVQAREMIWEMTHPVAGKLKMAGSPIKLSGAEKGGIRLPAPLLGEHTREVLISYLGLSPEEVNELAEAGAIGWPEVGSGSGGPRL
ncbi:MAG: CoA transferase [Firmicutes bacterium]|nr:CoA transferase [Bacillota bacterium]